MVTIKVGPYLATIDRGIWTSESETLVTLLNVAVRPNDIPGDLPNRDLYTAREAARRVLGELIDSGDGPHQSA